MFNLIKVRISILALGFAFLFLPLLVFADTLGQEASFNIDSSYDLRGREETVGSLQKIGDQSYFYVDREWWRGLTAAKRISLEVAIHDLAAEFDRKIYPGLTSVFGSEPSPGVDGDERITVLIHPMIYEAGGYFNSGDLYFKLQNPGSNEREMVYLNSQHLEGGDVKAFLAHEFTHLITANQKDLLRGVIEETWLNEARAEYSSTILGYDAVYKGSNLERRVRDFLTRPSVSLVEWLNRKEGYGAVNLFAQYLVDHYGRKILVDSLQSDKTGIESINLVLAENNHNKDFTQVFAEWAVALLANDCSLGDRYCYRNEHLKDFRITPTMYYLPRTETIMSSYHNSAYWAANWHRLIGGGSNLFLKFEGASSVEFSVPYLLCDLGNNCSVEFLTLNEGKGEISILEFSSKYSSLTIIPFIHGKVSGFNGQERSFSFSWQATIEDKTAGEKEAELIIQLQAQIAELRRQIAEYQMRISAILGNPASSQGFDVDLYPGLTNSAQVRSLQEFLISQGTDIYPEGLVTGNFLSLTQLAVIRFQEKYASEILSPLGLGRGTGYVGQATRTKINSLISQ